MPYSLISSRRMPYDIDGTAIGYRTADSVIASGITTWANSDLLGSLNSLGSSRITSGIGMVVWMFFPEEREVEAATIFTQNGSNANYPISLGSIEGSNDTGNGMDGTWEAATFPEGNPSLINYSAYQWRTNIRAVSFSGPKKVLRLRFTIPGGSWTNYISGIYLYGRKAAGQMPDDVLFCNMDGTEKTALLDWGDRPEGTTVIDSFKVKNASTIKIANDVNLQLNHSDYGLSFSENGPWSATLDITSIAANSLSTTIFARHLLGEPPLVLGPRAARCIAKVGSWS